VTARFISEDTYRGQKNDPLSLNLYTYCGNNPIIYDDPSGHKAKSTEADKKKAAETQVKAEVEAQKQIKLAAQYKAQVEAAKKKAAEAEAKKKAADKAAKKKAADEAAKKKAAEEAKNKKTNEVVTKEQLEQIGWTGVDDDMISDLNNTLVKYDITTPDRIINFISQVSHESGAGLYTTELGKKVYFEKYEPETEKGNELGNVDDGDGYKYRGAGYIQLTGKYNYEAFAEEMDDDEIMQGADYVAENYAWASAGFWWDNNNMNALVNSGASVDKISTRVNGRNPANGIVDRKRYYNLCVSVFK